MKANLSDTGGEIKGGRKGLVGGAVLIACGVVLLAGQVFTLGAWPLLLLGLVFTAAGISTHTAGWLIPGGVLNGIGLGALLVESGVAWGDPAEGGVFLLAFAAGWLSIYALSKLFTEQPQPWALIPAGVMALIGAPLLMGAAGEAALEVALRWTGLLWPVALIAVGLVVLLRRRS